MPETIKATRAMRRLVIVGLREEGEVVVEPSRTMRRRTAGILEGVISVNCRLVSVMSVGVEVYRVSSVRFN